jgi:hypothetical protein
MELLYLIVGGILVLCGLIVGSAIHSAGVNVNKEKTDGNAKDN